VTYRSAPAFHPHHDSTRDDLIRDRRVSPDVRSSVTAAVRRQPAYTRGADLYQTRTQLLHHWRQRVVELLAPRPGDVVIDVGCGTGLCFDLLQERVGPDGAIVGIDASAEMLDVARRRVADRGWRNVELVEAAAEDARLPATADAVLFCAVHDVLQSPAALRNVFAHTRPGGRVAAVGGKWAAPWAVGLNALVTVVHAPFVRSMTGFDRPWRHLARHVPDLRVEEIELGCGYLASGATARVRDA
jgi:demethylmenaquinone methyltransferase/2-methoxy-6-polyprenyl-1,4-benzoquinol methylase